VTLLELQSCLERRGVRLSARGDKLHFVAPKGALTPSIRAILIDQKPALLASLAGVEASVPVPARAGSPPAPSPRPSPRADPIVTRSAAVSSRLARHFAPRDSDAFRRYRLRLESPLWSADAVADDYRLAARLSILHARGARAYRNEWTDEDQSLADRVRSRRAALS
jgi:hypothetical protein